MIGCGDIDKVAGGHGDVSSDEQRSGQLQAIVDSQNRIWWW